jgi:peptide/nickel transport system substrate-binding protein
LHAATPTPRRAGTQHVAMPYNPAAVELPGYRELIDATMATPRIDERKTAFAKLQRFCIEQALELPQFIAPAVSIASPKLQNFTTGILNCPKFTQVWLEA